jgi:hypothetical protein
MTRIITQTSWYYVSSLKFEVLSRYRRSIVREDNSIRRYRFTRLHSLSKPAMVEYDATEYMGILYQWTSRSI